MAPERRGRDTLTHGVPPTPHTEYSPHSGTLARQETPRPISVTVAAAALRLDRDSVLNGFPEFDAVLNGFLSLIAQCNAEVPSNLSRCHHRDDTVTARSVLPPPSLTVRPLPSPSSDAIRVIIIIIMISSMDSESDTQPEAHRQAPSAFSKSTPSRRDRDLRSDSDLSGH
eukprot:368448-Rhodomonas_salina.1